MGHFFIPQTEPLKWNMHCFPCKGEICLKIHECTVYVSHAVRASEGCMSLVGGGGWEVGVRGWREGGKGVEGWGMGGWGLGVGRWWVVEGGWR